MEFFGVALLYFHPLKERSRGLPSGIYTVSVDEYDSLLQYLPSHNYIAVLDK